MRINGNTRVLVHLSYPSNHLRTPGFLNPVLVERDLNAVLVPWQVSPENLNQVFDALRVCESVGGVVVTIPHKTSVAGLCDELRGAAAFLKVANVARRTEDGRFIGEMFDGAGYIEGLRLQGHDVAGRKALLLGAGGAATGIAHAMVQAGVERLTIANRTRAKANNLARALNGHFNRPVAQAGEAIGAEHDLVINGTSVGLKADDPLPIDPETIRTDALVGEVIMQPDVTPLLRAAEARGCPIHAGKYMNIGQLGLLADFLLNPAS